MLFIVLILLVVFLSSCVDGVYDPEERARLNSLEPDMCEENDTFADAYDPSSDLDLLYLNFYDDIFDYFIIDFDADTSYTLKADVFFDHTADPLIYIYNAAQEIIDTSIPAEDDDRDAVITEFSPPSDGYYYVLVMNTFVSGTGEKKEYSLTITEE